MAGSDIREELVCSICLDIYTDPETLPCCHNFCQNCIGRVVGAQEEGGVYACPECRAQFPTDSAPQTNKTLGNVELFLSTHPEQGKIFCSYCIHFPVPAAQTCLNCEASLCAEHIKVHSKATKHILVEPTTSLESKICSIHKEPLKDRSSEDNASVCLSGCLAGEHREHKLNEASEKKKEKVLEKLMPERKDMELKMESLRQNMRKVGEKAAGEAERVSTLFRDIRDWLEVLEMEILGEISRQENEVSLQLSDLIHKLELKMDLLSRKIQHIEELCNTADPITVLQNQQSSTDDICGAEGEDDDDDDDGEKDDKKVPAAEDLDEDLVSESLQRGVAGILKLVKERLYGTEATDMYIDIDTAGNEVSVSGNGKTVFYSDKDQCHPETPYKFYFSQALSTNSFPSGRHYWEMECSESGCWRVGVAYASIGRHGGKSCIGNNTKSWALCRWGHSNYLMRHDSKVTKLSHIPTCSRIRILLDYEGGHLSFYELSDPIKHLHTFTATFTEPLHAAFFVWVDNAWVTVTT